MISAGSGFDKKVGEQFAKGGFDDTVFATSFAGVVCTNGYSGLYLQVSPKVYRYQNTNWSNPEQKEESRKKCINLLLYKQQTVEKVE